MNVFRRPEGRFALEALAIVAAAAVPGYLHVTWKHVLVLVIAVLVLSVLLETLVALRSRRRPKSEEPAPLLEDPVTPLEPEPEPEPELVAVEADPVPAPPSPEPPPSRVVEASPPPPPPKPRAPMPPQPRPQRTVPPPKPPDDVDQVVAAIFSGAPSPPPPSPPRQPPPQPATGPWKIAQLERALRAQPSPDPELLYMIGYLRDYADADGTLPAEFDELVRDAFGHALGLSR